MVLNYRTIIILTTMLLLISPAIGVAQLFTALKYVVDIVNLFLQFAAMLESQKINELLVHINENIRIIWSKTYEIGDQLSAIENKMDYLSNYISKEVTPAISKVHVDLALLKVLDDIDFIGRMHKFMQRFLNDELVLIIKGIKVNDLLLRGYTIESFASTLVSLSSRSVLMRFKRIQEQVLGTMESAVIRDENGGIYRQVLLYYKKGVFKKAYSSPNELVFALYTLIQMCQLKAYVLIQFSWLVLKIRTSTSFEKESIELRDQYLKHLVAHAEEVLDILSKAGNTYLKMDPAIYSRENYDEVTKLLPTGVILNEADISKGNTCWYNCDDYENTWQYRCYDSNSAQCRQQPPCKGRVTGCTKKAPGMSVCTPGYKENTRRYYFIKFDGKYSIGKEANSCSWRRIEYWRRFLVKCDYCWCFCDDSGDSNSYRHFNKRPVTSDIENNKIITGLRLRKVENVFFLEIQEGKLTEQYGVNFTTVDWQKIKSYRTEDAKIGEDYHSLTADSATIHLDDVILPEGYFLTGIKFTTVEGNLQLAIRGTKYDSNLKLAESESVWFNENPVANREAIDTGFALPTNYHNHETISKNASKITFKKSGYNEDVGQSIIPFVDIQVVAPLSPFPLSGGGIYHRGRTGSGGFIALKVFTYDTSKEVDIVLIKKISAKKYKLTFKELKSMLKGNVTVKKLGKKS